LQSLFEVSGVHRDSISQVELPWECEGSLPHTPSHFLTLPGVCDYAYACRVTLPVKKDGSRRLCGDYQPLNLQTRRDSFPMPLVDDVISQLGRSAWFTALDLQSGFWQIRMAPENMRKTMLITKSGLYDWTVMSFGLKNATSTFTRTMSEVFKDLGDKFLKVFVDDLNIHSES